MLVVICGFVPGAVQVQLELPKWPEKPVLEPISDQNVQMLVVISSFVPGAVQVQLELPKWPEEPVLEPISDHKTSRRYL